MVKQAWVELWVNAYNHVKPGDKIYKNGVLLGVASGSYSRPTHKTPGSVFLKNFISISGQVRKTPTGWEMEKN